MNTPPKKPDFSDVKSNVQSTAKETAKPDFSDVQSTVTSTAAKAKPVAQEYTVVAGDNLSKISKHFYGKSNHWQEIFEANRDTLKDPDHIYPGQVLTIPALDTPQNPA